MTSKPSSAAPSGWEPIVYFWTGGWIGIGKGRGGTVPTHAHHAVQISIGLDGPVRFREPEAEWQEMDGGLVLPNAPHGFDACGSAVAMIFVGPESREGRSLTEGRATPITPIDRDRISDHLPALATFDERRPDQLAAAEIITGVVRELCAGPHPVGKLDERIVRVLEAVGERDPCRPISLAEAARLVHLSPSRLAHLFKEEVGLPFRRYLLWLKLTRAMTEFGRGSNLSRAAHAAGFSDSAHLTRTWRQMFGVPPTAMLGGAPMYEIPAPFDRTHVDER